MNHLTVEDVADALHSLLCGWNHIDQCGWEYESWEKPTWTRPRWREKAERVLSTCDMWLPREDLINLIKTIRECR